MAKTINQAKDEIARLVGYFKKNYDYVHSHSYKEIDTRNEFIDPFFIALGWDVHNEKHNAMQYREVVLEKPMDVEGSKKAPDYVFRVGREPKFFVEAKKPGVQIKIAAGPAYQLRRYAWSAKLPLSILTDFEEMAVYECRRKPSESDKASRERIKFITYEDYIDHLEEIWDIFSLDAVLSGSFDQFTQSARGRRGTSEVDSEFLKEIEGWRKELAENLAIRNLRLGIDDLNDVVQLTIDRIIFLRMAEARGMEPFGQLKELADGKNIYKKLIKEPCRRADERYNSGLFDFTSDKLTPKLELDDRVMKNILSDLYYPKSPYEFSVLPAEILGNVYEQFLGKVIRLTAGHHAKVEEKPEVKKAGGVYYTPAYIVEYIVKNTVGKMVEDKSPKQLEKFRVLDMACGSGSFLLGAYDYLLNHYLEWYIAHNPGKYPKAVWRQSDDWRLTTSEKKRILLTHIFGVDIDRQAVEVTKLSLLLKVLEGENDRTLSQQMDLIVKERALPNLNRNIKCGNSLIGPDYFTGDLIPDRDEMKRVNPFDWNSEFKEIMKDGGFDCVIGNPPYGATLDETTIGYLRDRFQVVPASLDTYLMFYVRCMQDLLKDKGKLGYITPNTWELIFSANEFRSFLLNNFSIDEIVHYREPVFKGVTVDCEIVIFSKISPVKNIVKITILGKREIPLEHEIKQDYWISKNGLPFSIWLTTNEAALTSKISSSSTELSEICTVFNGVKPFEVGKGNPPQTKKILAEKPYVSDTQKNKSFKSLLGGSLINRYENKWDNNYWISYGPWLAAPRNKEIFDAPSKIVIRQTGDSLIATIIDDKYICRDNLHIILPGKKPINLNYILGLLNSSLMNFFYESLNPERGEALAQIKKKHVEQLPIRNIDFGNPIEKKQYSNMIHLVECMLDLHKRLHSTESESEREIYQRQIDATDRQIDSLVYELYGLTDEEIRIVEESA